MNILKQYDKKIKGTLSTFDRIIIKGYIRQLCNVQQFKAFLSIKNILWKDFPAYAQNVTKNLCEHIENLASNQNRPYTYLKSPNISKEQTALDMLKESPVNTGLIGIIGTVETCNSISVTTNRETKQLQLNWGNRKCKYYYLYFLDEEFGFMHVKIQTWFPFMVQIYINGREYLSKKLDKENIKYSRYDNCFTDIENIERAQELADKIDSKNLSSSFDGIIQKINNYLPTIEKAMGHAYFWCVSECEYATDIMFKSRKDLEEIYPSLVEHAFFSFKCEDIMTFLGRKMHAAFQGELGSDYRKRKEGIRIKHKMKSNSIKMYDKYSVLRIETTINDPHEFKILKNVRTNEGYEVKRWVPMGKSIANLYRYKEVSEASNMRYIEALGNAIDKSKPIEEIEKVSSKIIVKGRRYTGFNILDKETTMLFKILSNGRYMINGFKNSDIKYALYGERKDIESIKVRNRVTRLLAKLRAHKLIKKVPNGLKYYVTEKGRKIISQVLYFKTNELPIICNK